MENEDGVNIASKQGSSETVNSSLTDLKVETVVETVKMLQTKEDLDLHGQKILDTLTEDVITHSDIFQMWVEKAHLLIKSTFFMKIIQKMAETSKKDTQTGLLDKLLKQTDDAKDRHPDDYQNFGEQNHYSTDLFTSCYQEKVLSLIKILLTVDGSLDSRTKCLRILVRSAGVDCSGGQMTWTMQMRDTVKLLLREGADPTWIRNTKESTSMYAANITIESNLSAKVRTDGPQIWLGSKDHGLPNLICDGTKESALLMFAFGIVHWAAYDDNVNVSDLEELLWCFLTGKYLNHRESQGTVLHALVKCNWNTCQTFRDLPTQCMVHYTGIIFNVVKANPALVEVTNDSGQTPLHILAKIFCEFPPFGKIFMAILPCLTTSTNVNATDKFSATPYSWIYARKAEIQNRNEKCSKVLSDVEEIFIRNGADVERARAGSISPVLIWLNRELLNKNCTPEILQGLLSYMKTLQNWASHPYNGELDDYPCVWDNLCSPKNPKLIHLSLAIIEILVGNESITKRLWIMRTSRNLCESVTLTDLEVFGICAKGAALPNDRQMNKILSCVNAVKENDHLTKAFLKILVALQRKRFTPCNLDFLVDHYIISQEILQLARNLVQGIRNDQIIRNRQGKYVVYSDRFRPMNRLISYMSPDPFPADLEDSWFEENWLNRSALHLAVIWLHKDELFNSLPNVTVKKYINARDVHGCTPLHVAYMHQNEPAVKFLLSQGADEEAKDNFGILPKSSGLYVRAKQIDHHNMKATKHSGEDIDDRHYQLCRRVLETKSRVLESMIPMLVLNKEDAQTLCTEMRTLFERLVKDTKFSTARIVIGGSMRECLKAGRFDEVDVQIRFEDDTGTGASETFSFQHLNKRLADELLQTLARRLRMISWEEIHLRPISVKGPWMFIREGCGQYRGMMVSVDVVVVVPDFERTRSEWPDGRYCHKKQQDILEGAPMHRNKQGILLATWKDGLTQFDGAFFEYEWDVIDSLPTSHRLAIVIAKALVQAYNWCRGDRHRVEMPITSYVIKTTLFYILSGRIEIYKAVAAEQNELMHSEYRPNRGRKQTAGPGNSDNADGREHSQRAGPANSDGGEDSQRAGPANSDGGEDSQRASPANSDGGEDSQRTSPANSDGGEDSQRASPANSDGGEDSQRTSPANSEGVSRREDGKRKENVPEGPFIGEKGKRIKLKFNPTPRWITKEDVNTSAEEARQIACEIFKLIQYFADRNSSLDCYWQFDEKTLWLNFGVGKNNRYKSDICDYVLERLSKDSFN